MHRRSHNHTDLGAPLEALGRRDPYWPAQLSVLAALLLHFALPERLTVGPRWLVPGLEAVLLIGLVVLQPDDARRETSARRRVDVLLIALVTAANVAALALLLGYLLGGGRATGHQLILSAIDIWLTNVIAFGLWYWQLDRGGPGTRARGEDRRPDFLFPQMADAQSLLPNWKPGFVDYLYVSFTNSTAFSPTDTMPLSRMAKLLMLVQALVALVTVALVAARAVNLLR